MKINEVEQLVGITKKNIRFYEEQGLLNPSRNKDNGYREYSEENVRVLEQIKLLRKLGLPLEEIRMMQSGRSTVADSMRRHLVTLEREKQNLMQSEALCSRLKDEDGTLQNLDAKVLLGEMDRLEQGGTAFQNKHRYDVRMSYVAPVIITLGMMVFMGGLIALLIWGTVTAPEEAPPLAFIAVVILILLCVAGGTLLALMQRIGEIKKGEMDDARKY